MNTCAAGPRRSALARPATFNQTSAYPTDAAPLPLLSVRHALIPNLLDGDETSPTTATPGLLKLPEPNPYSDKLH